MSYLVALHADDGEQWTRFMAGTELADQLRGLAEAAEAGFLRGVNLSIDDGSSEES